MNQELPDAQAGFRKGRRTRDQIANICWIIEKSREFQKNIYFIDYATAFDCVDHDKLCNRPVTVSTVLFWAVSQFGDPSNLRMGLWEPQFTASLSVTWYL